LWGSLRRDARGAARGDRAGAGGVEPGDGAARVPRIQLAEPGSWDLGSAGAEAELHPFEDDGVGGVRSGDSGGGRVWAGRAGDSLAALARRAPPGNLRARLQPRAGRLYAVLRIGLPGREPAADAGGRLSSGIGSAGGPHDRIDRPRTQRGWLPFALRPA